MDNISAFFILEIHVYLYSGGNIMLTEQRIQKVLDKVVHNIQVTTDIVDTAGVIVASSDRERVGRAEPIVKDYDAINGKPTFVYNGRTYMRFTIDKAVAYFIAMDGVGNVVRNYCVLIASIIELYLKSNMQKLNREEVVRRVILAQVSDLELQELVREYKLEPNVPRCVLVIRTSSMEAENVYRLLLKVFPKSQGDILILFDSRTVILVKRVQDDIGEDELGQMAAAMEETILNEITVKICIGIGQIKPNIFQLRESYLEAIQAIEVGLIYGVPGRIYRYDSLLLERFLHEIPIQISQKYCKTIFNEEARKVLNEEMITTVNRFFENNLNLSETARQLYIHRNTLVYRLDKIQKTLGLDLRNFHDAVTFKIMMMLNNQRNGSVILDTV